MAASAARSGARVSQVGAKIVLVENIANGPSLPNVAWVLTAQAVLATVLTPPKVPTSQQRKQAVCRTAGRALTTRTPEAHLLRRVKVVQLVSSQHRERHLAQVAPLDIFARPPPVAPTRAPLAQQIITLWVVPLPARHVGPAQTREH